MVEEGQDPESVMKRIEKAFLKPRQEELERKVEEEGRTLPQSARHEMRKHIERLKDARKGGIGALIEELEQKRSSNG